ncbi:MAG: hypothetical protein QM754_18300 [Tepidisphaeraceae bacterium]
MMVFASAQSVARSRPRFPFAGNVEPNASFNPAAAALAMISRGVFRLNGVRASVDFDAIRA